MHSTDNKKVSTMLHSGMFLTVVAFLLIWTITQCTCPLFPTKGKMVTHLNSGWGGGGAAKEAIDQHPSKHQTYFSGPYNLHYLFFSGMGALLCHHPNCFLSKSQTWVEVSCQGHHTLTLFKTKIVHFATLLTTRDLIFWPWFILFHVWNSNFKTDVTMKLVFFW